MAITPWRRSAGVRLDSFTTAPRSLKELVNCRFSNLSQILAPVSCDSVREWRQGVRSTAPLIKAAAARTWLKPGAMELSSFKDQRSFGAGGDLLAAGADGNIID